MTSVQVAIDEAQEQLPELVERALQGEEVLIGEPGKLAVRLVPTVISGDKRIAGLSAGSIGVSEDFDAPLPDAFRLRNDRIPQSRESFRQPYGGDMTVEPTILANNQSTRERLESLVARLTDEELGRGLGDGRTIATILGHVAFWDQRTLILLRRWLDGKSLPSPSDTEPEDVDWINDATHEFCLLIPPRQLAHFALNTAREVDQLVETVPTDLVTAIQAAGTPISLNRGVHRGEHLDEIERFLNE